MAAKLGALGLRAFHLDLKWQHYRFDRYLALLEDLAEWGYNAVILEYENMFPYARCRRAVHRDAWSPRQIQQFTRKAAGLGIQVIPLIQCFGHLEFVLRLPAYRRLAENPEHPSELCPCKDGASRLVQAMIDEVLTAHPQTPYIHIGGDEVWSLGTCPRCRRNVRRLGKSRIYIDFVKPFIDQVLAAGKRPILWADMLLAHPEALDAMSRDAVLCDWEYWPQGLAEPHVLDWSSGTWVSPMTLPLVAPRTRKRFGPYWAAAAGRDYPSRVAGWPYAAYLRKAGFDVITGSAIKSGGDNYSAVRYPLHLDNCLSAAEAAARTGCLGQIVTSWVIRRVPMENQFLLAALTGAAMRNPGAVDVDVLAARYERNRFGQRLGLLDIYASLGAMVHCLNMTNFGRYAFGEHRIAPPSIDDEVSRAGGAPGRTPLLMRETANNGLHAADAILAALGSAGLEGREIDVLRFSAEEVLYKARLVYAVCEHLRGRKLDPAAIRKQTNRLKHLLQKTFAGHWTDWTIRDELRYRYGPDEAWVAGLDR
jgi:hypothetical protein